MSNPIELVPLSTYPELINQFNSMSSTFDVETLEKGTIWFNGMKYVGQYKIGSIKHGYGVLYKNGKIVYEGEFQDNLYNGLGTLYHPYGWTMYKGMFKNGEYHGQGIEYNRYAMNIYKGEWNNGEKLNK
jgi:hypothetical protein